MLQDVSSEMNFGQSKATRVEHFIIPVELIGTSIFVFLGDMLVPNFNKFSPSVDSILGRESFLTACTSFICTCSLGLMGALMLDGWLKRPVMLLPWWTRAGFFFGRTLMW